MKYILELMICICKNTVDYCKKWLKKEKERGYKYVKLFASIVAFIAMLCFLYKVITFVQAHLSGTILSLLLIALTVLGVMKLYNLKQQQTLQMQEKEQEESKKKENSKMLVTHGVIERSIFEVISDTSLCKILGIEQPKSLESLNYTPKAENISGVEVHNIFVRKNAERNVSDIQKILQKEIQIKLANGELPKIKPKFVSYTDLLSPVDNKENLNVFSVESEDSYYVIKMALGSREFFEYQENLQLNEIESSVDYAAEDKDFSK